MRSLKFSGLLKKPKAPIIIRQVVGTSMVPTFMPGAIVIGYRTARITVGDIVLVTHQGLDKIKRVSAVTDDTVSLIGDNPEQSYDSRHYGAVPRASIRAKILIQRRPDSRA